MDWHIILSEGFKVHSNLRKHIERIMDHESWSMIHGDPSGFFK